MEWGERSLFFITDSWIASYDSSWLSRWISYQKQKIMLKDLWSPVQFSCLFMSDSATPWTAARQASLSITNSWSLLKLMAIESVMPSSHLILCRPFLLLPPIPPSIRVFSNEPTHRMRCQNIGVSASASVLPMNTQDWSPLGWTGWTSLQSKGFSSLLQHHSSKASILQCSVFFTVQPSHPYMTTGKTILD